ncbi:NUDIX hydrolase [Streptomyces sp. TP-A0874]|uniref:NUDIX hydrolase n=1 Tax=Streptomyces sp. TP-A0874 TaxID=549819 RepID=UPI0008529EEA|nr:NUDIX hydrolase [Streptomyces sp. TP-A0874]
MIVWLNGAFGTGKTATARELVDVLPGATFYDPESVVSGLRTLLPAKRLEEADDYQELPSWRRLLVETAAAALSEVPGPLVVPMTLLDQAHRDEIFGGFAARGISVRHVLLHTDETILRTRAAIHQGQRPDGDDLCGPRPEAGSRIERYRAALPWLSADAHIVDVGRLTSRQAAERVAAAVRAGAGNCDIVQTPEPATETLAAGVLLFDQRDRVLLVDPTYKPGWEFPGGIVEPGEAPARAGMREVAEETGIRLERVPGLLIVDWEPPEPPKYGGLRLLFDGGRLGSEECDRVLLPDAELRDWRFVTESEAERLLPTSGFNRLRWALRAREQATVLNLEAGVPVG